jgi:hypothetical protein
MFFAEEAVRAWTAANDDNQGRSVLNFTRKSFFSSIARSCQSYC